MKPPCPPLRAAAILIMVHLLLHHHRQMKNHQLSNVQLRHIPNDYALVNNSEKNELQKVAFNALLYTLLLHTSTAAQMRVKKDITL